MSKKKLIANFPFELFWKGLTPATKAKGSRMYNKFKDDIHLLVTNEGLAAQVPSESVDDFYIVNFSATKGNPSASCSCPVMDSILCKHMAAACLAGMDGVISTDNKKVPEQEKSLTTKKETIIEPEATYAKVILSDSDSWIVDCPPERIFEFVLKRKYSNPRGYSNFSYPYSYPLPIKIADIGGGRSTDSWVSYDGIGRFEFHCKCLFPRPCVHNKELLARIGLDRGEKFFTRILSMEEREKRIRAIGFDTNDLRVNEFSFVSTWQDELVINYPKWFVREQDFEHILLELFPEGVKGAELEAVKSVHNPSLVIRKREGTLAKQIGFEFALRRKSISKTGKDNSKIVSISSQDGINLMRGADERFRSRITPFSYEYVMAWLKSNKYISNRYSYRIENLEVDRNARWPLLERLRSQTAEAWPEIVASELIYVESENEKGKLQAYPFIPKVDSVELIPTVTESEGSTQVSLNLQIGDERYDEYEYVFVAPFFVLIEENIYFVQNPNAMGLLSKLGKNALFFSDDSKGKLLTELLPRITQHFKVDVPDALELIMEDVDPVPFVEVSELNNQFIIVAPKFKYHGTITDLEEKRPHVNFTREDGKMVMSKRNWNVERNFMEEIKQMHYSFSKQISRNSFHITFSEAKKNSWFPYFVQQLSERNITVIGLQEMKHMRFNHHKPEMKMQATSGIDWFDLQMEVWFGEEKISLDRVRKAILQRQEMVILDDGSMGILPAEWIERYEMLFKMAEPNGQQALKLSKHHFTMLESLEDGNGNEQILEEIKQRKELIYNAQNLVTVKPSSKIKGELRPYQLLGYQWLQLMDEMKLGACLADDMGLGKTLQTITFIQFLKEKYKGQTSLVICPISLIFNWENELKKFAPTIKFKVHYGLDRMFDDNDFAKYDLILTSYSVMRIDVEMLASFTWKYIILDESQAIKNPDSQTAKALQTLKAYNRIALSGTPVQNNTFDLYSQLNFLNPGLLGNKQFFKEEFANAIDKDRDPIKTKQLRKMVYPFMLRRTKEQVATDLPEKMESIIWCEMSASQRAVYDEYKKYFRDALLQKIDAMGMSKVGVYVLEGLLRLRQICDSPKLLKKPEFLDAGSAKVEELMREIEDNIGDHKILVFSQFTEMLQLIVAELNQRKLTFAYLDGSTKQDDRRVAVNKFQEETDCRIFLISLKAGGVGLNLTAADYVYLIDPWWNPAAEQQAIDRTHRIGQTKKIIAYKMICRDSVEEKILLMQQNKKRMAGEIIGEDEAIMKRLKREDIEFLFS